MSSTSTAPSDAVSWRAPIPVHTQQDSQRHSSGKDNMRNIDQRHLRCPESASNLTPRPQFRARSSSVLLTSSLEDEVYAEASAGRKEGRNIKSPRRTVFGHGSGSSGRRHQRRVLGPGGWNPSRDQRAAEDTAERERDASRSASKKGMFLRLLGMASVSRTSFTEASN